MSKDYHKEFRERTVTALKEACKILINNAEAIVGSPDYDLGLSCTTITITLPSLTDDEYVIPGIDVSQSYVSHRVVEHMYGDHEIK